MLSLSKHGPRNVRTKRRLMNKVAAVILAVSVLLGAGERAGAADRAVGCGGAPLKYDLSIALVGSLRGKQEVRSVVAVAAVVPADSSHPRPQAWMIWDERGMPWLGLKQTSPADLQSLWQMKGRPDFTNWKLLRYTPVKLPLPRRYLLMACVDTVNG